MATIKEVKTYDITINDFEFKGFEKLDVWNGLVEYRNSQGIIIAVENHSFVDDLFSGVILNKKAESKEFTVVMSSPVFQLDMTNKNTEVNND